MTREELEKSFEHPMYDELREDLKRVMDAYPKLTDRGTVEAAAERLQECRGDGVELSVENAVRLALYRDPIPPMSELVELLNKAGVTNENVTDVVMGILDMEIPAPTGKPPKQSAVEKSELLVGYAKTLTDQNEDIVLMGVPDIDPGWGFAQLKLAFFSENLTEEQKKTILAMKGVADKSKVINHNGYAELLFYIESL